MTKEDYLSNPEKLLYKKPFTRGVNEDYIQLFRDDIAFDSETIAKLPSYSGKSISQAQYLLELDPSSHAIMFNDDLPRLSNNPNASWDEANPYRASFSFQKQILNQHNQYVNTKGMKFILLNTKPDDVIRESFVEIKDEWVTRNMDVWKERLYKEQKSTGDGALLFYYNNKQKCKVRLLSYRKGYTLIPQYDENEEMILFSVYYKSEKKLRMDVYDDENIYRYVNLEKDWVLESTEAHGFSEIPVVYKRGSVAWEDGQVLIDIFELLYNIYMIIEKKVGFPMLYIIGKADLAKKSDTAVMLQDKSIDNSKSDAKFLNPDEPTGFQKLLEDLFKKIQICTSSVLLAADEIKITADVSGLALKMMRSAIYEKAQEDIRDYDEVADKMFALFKDGVSKELKRYTYWKNCRIRAEYDLWMPQSETDVANRLITQKQAGIISAETATDLSPDSQPDEHSRLEKEAAELAAKEIVEPINME